MDNSGKTVGKSTTTGNTTVHKDAQGKTVGKTVTK
jgi:YD repeat-containing protein